MTRIRTERTNSDRCKSVRSVALFCFLVTLGSALVGCAGLRSGTAAITPRPENTAGAAVPQPQETNTAQSGQGNIAATLQTLLADPDFQAGLVNIASRYAAEFHLALSAAQEPTARDHSTAKAQGLGQIFGDSDSLTTLVTIGVLAALVLMFGGGLTYALVWRPLGLRAKSPPERKRQTTEAAEDAGAYDPRDIEQERDDELRREGILGTCEHAERYRQRWGGAEDPGDDENLNPEPRTLNPTTAREP
ncbi:MAG: hypothetical protein PHU85_00375 [Phycisphaerae bacterium]|nr:hypothetical protein [Phycisphaerae bacterium]